MSWFDLRNRSPDPNAALLRTLMQMKIDDEIQAHQPEDQEHTEQGIESESRLNLDDSLSWSFLRDVDAGSQDRNYIPLEPDLNKLRLWLKSEHGGHVLKDHSKMGNIINIMGHSPPTLTKIGDQDGLTGNRLCNIMDGGNTFEGLITENQVGSQFIRVSDNPNVRIKEMLSTDSISFMCRIFVLTDQKDLTRNGILFSKIDDEQVTSGYLAQIDDTGHAYFFVRRNSKEYWIKSDLNLFAFAEKADYQPEYYQEEYYKVHPGISEDPLNVPVIPFTDLIFTCSFTNMRLTIKKDGVVVADSNTLPKATGLVASFGLNEGGNIGTTAAEQTPSLKTVFNTAPAAGATNGTISGGAIWSNALTAQHESYLQFDGLNSRVLASTYAGIQNFTEFTVSLWYYPFTIPAVSAFHFLFNLDWQTDGSFIIYVNNLGRTVVEVRNDAAAKVSASTTSSLAINTWYHIVATWKAGEAANIYVNNVKVVGGGTLAGTLTTAASLILGSTASTSTPNGIIDDVDFWNRRLVDAEVTTLHDTGHPLSSFPPWQADPPIPSESPGPITNPFSKYFDVDYPADAAQRDSTKLHAKIISGFSTFYDTNDDVDIAGSSQNLPYNAIYDVQPTGGGGGGGPPEVICDVSQNSSSHVELSSEEDKRAGNQLQGGPHVGKTVTKIIPRGRRQGSPSGTVYGRVWNSSGGLKATIGSYSVSSWSTSDTNQPEFTGAGTAVLAVGDVVGIEFSGGDSDNNLDLQQDDDSGTEPNWSGRDSLGTSGGWGQEDIGSGTDIGMQIYAAAGGGAAGGYPLLKPWNEDRAPFAPMINTRVGAAISSTSFQGIGKKITKVVVQMTKIGSPGGTINCKIFKNGSTTNFVQIGPSKTAADIPTAQGNVTFEFATEAERIAQTYALVSGDIIGIEVVGGSSSDTNYYIVHHNDTSSISYIWAKYYNTVSPSTGWQYTVHSGGQTSTNSANEIVGQFYEAGFTQTLPAVTAYTKLDHATQRVTETFATGSAAIGKVITRISPRFRKVLAPTGSVSVVIRNSNGTLMTSFGTIDAVVDIPGDDAWTIKDFTNITNTRATQAGDIVSVEYASGDANNYVKVSINLNHDNYDTNKSYLQQWLTGASVYTNPTTGGGSPAGTNYDLAGTMATGGIQTDPAGRTRVGQRVNSPNSVMRGKKATRAIFYLHRVGSPTAGTFVNLRVRKADTDAIAFSIGTISAPGLQTTPTAYTIENINNVYIMQQNDILTVEYEGGDDSNYVVLTRTKTDTFETTGNLSQMVDYNAPIYNALASDWIGEMWTGGDTYTPAVDEQIIRDPFYHHDLLVGAGGWDWSYYAAVGTILNHIGVHLMPEFRIYKQDLTVQQALNLFTNRCTISTLALGKVAKVGTFGVAVNP